MDRIIEKTVADITANMKSGSCCSQSTLLGLCDNLGCSISPDVLRAMASGFRGGIGGTHDEGTCGALSAGIIAIGLLNPGDDRSTVAMSKQLYRHFRECKGSVQCRRILEADGHKNCVSCCTCVGEMVARLICGARSKSVGTV